jgi:hypothetical protein
VTQCLPVPRSSPSTQRIASELPGYCRALLAHSHQPVTGARP